MKSSRAKLSGTGRPAMIHQPAPTALNTGQPCPIVGVGASAGGLEAFMQLLKHLPCDTGFGFVLVQHLDPKHESALTQLLKPGTSMPVREAANNLRVEANHIYVIPPNTSLGIARGVLKLQPRSQERIAPRSIDFFFEGLAKDKRERAIGVILSGTATDGTLGLEAIKAEGGLTFAQDDSARYDSMPRSAIAAGCVDLILSPEQIAKELARIASHPYVAGRREQPIGSNGMRGIFARGGEIPPSSRSRIVTKTNGRDLISRAPGAGAELVDRAGENGYDKILQLLCNHCGVDFSLYKSSTIRRRITRRTVLNRRSSLEKYADFLRGNVRELDALYSDALISVTSFFRNADAFGTLKQKVFPRLLQLRSDEPVRVWVLGCSTGQEAYSIAMSFAEAADRVSRPRKLQVFATDLNEANLEKARHGLYATSVAQDVSPERLRRFFVEEKGGYRIIKPLRELVVFARQNLISDPHFSRMDLISCRNLMIYLQPSLQKKALAAFHYSLQPEGFLFLGASESVGGFTDLFEPVDKKQKIFSKKTAPLRAFHLPVRSGHREPFTLQPTSRAFASSGRGGGGFPDVLRGELNAEREADRVTINQFAPPGVLINADLQILQFRGPTDGYLEPPTGKARFDLLKMTREGLMLPLRAAINRAKKENKAVHTENVPLQQNGEIRAVNVEVIPLKNLKECRFLVLFEESGKRTNASRRERSGGVAASTEPISKKEASSRIAGLERELAEARDYLKSVQEDQEAANEELQTSNEEGQSANEELQSLNEELETSKEELESTNEELSTVNEEMAGRNAELNRLNNDLTNFQTSTNLVIVLLGRDLTIHRFSAQAEKHFNLQASDVGRPFGRVRHNLDLPDLDALIFEVIASGRECACEVLARDGRWYSLRVRPYLTVDNKVEGAVLVLVDIDDLKRTERLISEGQAHAEAIIRTVPNPLVILNAGLRIQSANVAFYRSFEISVGATEGRLIYELDHASWNIPRLRHLLEEIIPRNGVFDDFEVTHDFKRIGRRSLLLNARLLSESGGRPKEILLGIRDVTARQQTEDALQSARAQLAEHAGQLNDLVIKRTAQLTTTNQRLKASVDSVSKGKEEYRALFLESQAMQKKLRHVARLIIAAQEEERKKISRELHDEVVQTLVGINVELSALGTIPSLSVRTLKEKIVRTQRLVENSVHAVHRFARGLRPAVLDDLGLIPALHAYSKDLAARKKIKIQLKADARVESLESARRTVLYRVAQEALTNVARHAHASEVIVTINIIADAIRMEISDNGRSFPVEKTLLAENNTRLGLIGMKERVEMVGGTLAIESTPGIGTTVCAEIPFNPRKIKK